MVGVKPMRWTTIERETGGGPVCVCVDASEGCKEVDQHQAHMHTDDDGDLVIVLFVLVVLVDGRLVVARQPRIPTDATCESTRNFLVLDWLLDDSAQMSDGGWMENQNNDGFAKDGCGDHCPHRLLTRGGSSSRRAGVKGRIVHKGKQDSKHKGCD